MHGNCADKRLIYVTMSAVVVAMHSVNLCRKSVFNIELPILMPVIHIFKLQDNYVNI